MKKFVLTVLSLGLLSALLLPQSAGADTSAVLFPFHNGSFNQLTPSLLGARNSSMVDEARCNGKVDYNFTNVVGAKDTYSIDLSSVPNGAILTGIDIIPCASENLNQGNLASRMNVFYRLNGNNGALSRDYVLPAGDPVELARAQFAGLSVIKNNNTSLQVGAVLSAGNRGMRLSHMAVVLTYAPMPAPTNVIGLSSGNRVTVIWTDNAKTEQGYVVERFNQPTNTFVRLGQVDANSMTYTDINMAPGTYVYKVSAVNSGSSSEPGFGSVTVQ